MPSWPASRRGRTFPAVGGSLAWFGKCRALDRWGLKPFLLVGLGGYTVSILVFALADTVTLLTVARFFQGLGSAFLWIAMFTMQADLSVAEPVPGKDVLTLQTCTLPDYSKRLITRAELVEEA